MKTQQLPGEYFFTSSAFGKGSESRGDEECSAPRVPFFFSFFSFPCGIETAGRRRDGEMEEQKGRVGRSSFPFFSSPRFSPFFLKTRKERDGREILSFPISSNFFVIE